MSAQVTEAHRELAAEIVFLRARSTNVDDAAQLIADSEARATATLRHIIEVTERSRDTYSTAAFELAAERDQLRAEVERLNCVSNFQRNIDIWQLKLTEAIARAERAEAELKHYTDAVDAQPWASDAPIRVLLDQITSELLTTRNLLMADAEAEAELAKERARLDWLQNVMTPDANYCEVFFAGLRNWSGEAHAYQIESNPQRFPTLNAATVRDAIDAAMKEGA